MDNESLGGTTIGYEGASLEHVVELADSAHRGVSSGSIATSVDQNRQYTPKVHGTRYTASRALGAAVSEHQEGLMAAVHAAHLHLAGDKLLPDPIPLPSRSWLNCCLNVQARVLDAGTGTGSWVFDVAASYLNVDVVAADDLQIQPADVPYNCSVEIDDLTKEWTWLDDPFDLIHVRDARG
ncbi:hypothetical protein MFIFM68171_02062 [Madurella fahalii]|uniref:Methyltransferase domain-containing protein n=1 Tax=Madurella fahalii TaxID=1157608 RepID=A0ABQ0G288_9PEZI